MSIFSRKLWDLFHEDAQAKYHETYNEQMKLLQQSSAKLKDTANTVISQAIATVNQLNQNIELYEKRIDAIVDDVDNLIIIKTVDYQWIMINQFACNALGIDKQSCIGKTTVELIAKYPQLKKLFLTLQKIANQSIITHMHITKIIKVDIGETTHKFEFSFKPIELHDCSKREIVIVGKEIQ